jgi:hypothetical protein
MKNYDPIGNRNRDFPICSPVPQPTASPHTPSSRVQILFYYVERSEVHQPKVRASRFRLFWGHVGSRNNLCLEGPGKKWKIWYSETQLNCCISTSEQYYWYSCVTKSRNSAVGILMGLWDPSFECRRGQDIFLFCQSSRQMLEPSHSSIPIGTEVLSLWGNMGGPRTLSLTFTRCWG